MLGVNFDFHFSCINIVKLAEVFKVRAMEGFLIRDLMSFEEKIVCFFNECYKRKKLYQPRTI